MGVMISCATGCVKKDVGGGEFEWTIDRFDDVKVLRYQVPGFENLPLEQKMVIYYLSEAALSGRDILFDQNFRYNLPVRRTLEGIYRSWEGSRESAEWTAFETYLKKVWFANGVHHHYSGDKFVPGFSEEYFDKILADTPIEELPVDFAHHDTLFELVKSVIFDPEFYAVRINQTEGQDLLATSAMNYYEGVTQAEAEKFYADMVAAAGDDPTPISYGLNSKLTTENGTLRERVWKEGGMYGEAISPIVSWLEKARDVAAEPQKEIISNLIK
jgi:dipeptidyl-peptidase-3